jgi:hypothetical protein
VLTGALANQRYGKLTGVLTGVVPKTCCVVRQVEMEEGSGESARCPPVAANPDATDVHVSKEAVKPANHLFTVMTTIRAKEVDLATVPGLAKYRLVEEEKKRKNREKSRESIRKKRKGTNSQGNNNTPVTTLDESQEEEVIKEKKRDSRYRHEGKSKGLAGIYHESNFVEVLPDGQAFMLQNLPTITMQALMHATDHVCFQAYFRKHGIEISSTLTEAVATAPQKVENDAVPTRGRYLMFYWQESGEKTTKHGTLNPRVTGGSVTENRKRSPGRSFRNSCIVDSHLGIPLETVLGLVTRGLQNKANWPTRNDTQPEFGVVGTGSVPVHQELHCDNEASYKLALATSLAVYRPMFERGRVQEAKEIQKRLNCEIGWVMHMPVTLEGLALRVAVYTDLTMKTVAVREIFVPFGCCLLLRADVFHSGHYGSPHNIRLHGVLPANNLEWMDGSLLFLNSERPFKMPDVVGRTTATDPSYMLQEKFNPIKPPYSKGKTSSHNKSSNNYISTFKDSIQAEQIQAVFDRQYALLRCKGEIMKASLRGGGNDGKRKNDTRKSRELMTDIYRVRDATIAEAVGVLEEAEAKARRQQRTDGKADQAATKCDKSTRQAGTQFRPTFRTKGKKNFDKNEFLRWLTEMGGGGKRICADTSLRPRRCITTWITLRFRGCTSTPSSRAMTKRLLAVTSRMKKVVK